MKEKEQIVNEAKVRFWGRATTKLLPNIRTSCFKLVSKREGKIMQNVNTASISILPSIKGTSVLRARFRATTIYITYPEIRLIDLSTLLLLRN